MLAGFGDEVYVGGQGKCQAPYTLTNSVLTTVYKVSALVPNVCVCVYTLPLPQ